MIDLLEQIGQKEAPVATTIKVLEINKLTCCIISSKESALMMTTTWTTLSSERLRLFN
jgi:hypothetical protein